MRYAIVQEGRVINVTEADPDHLPELPGVELVPSKTAGIGWTYADGTFKAPPAQPAAPPPINWPSMGAPSPIEITSTTPFYTGD